MVILETAAVVGFGVYKYRKHKENKQARAAAIIPTVREPVPAQSRDGSAPPSYRSAILSSPSHPANTDQPFSAESTKIGSKTTAAEEESLLEPDRDWRPVYLLERSTSEHRFNEVRTHRALFVGELYGDNAGRSHEIRKVKSSSLFGAQVPFSRKMRYTDAEEWVGSKAEDRDPVLLGYTDWTDGELNLKGELEVLCICCAVAKASHLTGHEMVDQYPAYSLTYSNCQHFVADLAEIIIPEKKQIPAGMQKLVPTFDQLRTDILEGEYEGHGSALIYGAAGISMVAATNTVKFFHFTTAVLKSMAKLDWRPFEEYMHTLRKERLRQLATVSRENVRLGPRYIAMSKASGSSQNSVAGSRIEE